MKEQEPINQPPEQESSSYLRVARFRSEETSGRAYFEAQQAIFHAEQSDLSVFRLQWEQAWHVAVIGIPPPRPLARRVNRALAGGEPATLPEELVILLEQRRSEAVKQAPWVERHFRPGRGS
jgi:hypothetical protein